MTSGRFIVGILLILLGISFWSGISLWHYFWPLLLIAIGVRMLTGSGHNQPWRESEISQNDELHEEVFFWGINKKIKSKNFNGGKIDCLLGGGKLDLSETEMGKNGEAQMEINCVLGGMEIVVPETWLIKSENSSMLGGINDQSEKPAKPSATLKIKCSAVLGGIEIHN